MVTNTHFLFGPGRVLPHRKLLVPFRPVKDRHSPTSYPGPTLCIPRSPDTLPTHVPSCHLQADGLPFSDPFSPEVQGCTIGGVPDLPPDALQTPQTHLTEDRTLDLALQMPSHPPNLGPRLLSFMKEDLFPYNELLEPCLAHSLVLSARGRPSLSPGKFTFGKFLTSCSFWIFLLLLS